MSSNYPLWKIGLSCAVTVAITFISIRWMRNKKISKSTSNNGRSTTELLDHRWKKVGKVKELYCYPLKSGRGKDVTECKFTEFRISLLSSDNQFTLRDRMFLVYNEENGKFVTGKNYPKLVLVNLYADEMNVRLEAKGMQSLVFDPQNCKAFSVDCSMWWDEPMKCNDCGDAVAEWISIYLTGQKSGLRVGVTTYQKRNLHEGPWEKFTKVYKTLSNDDTGLFADITSYMLMTESSLNELNNKLKRSVTSLQFRPNIVVSETQQPFAEDKWEWIKIGEKIVIRNVKPCPRCAVIRIDPVTGNVDDEPLKCLREFRAQDDPQKISVDGTAPTFGIYCLLYASGNVTIGDDVFVHV